MSVASQISSSYVGGTCFDHKSFAYQPRPRITVELSQSERNAIFEAAFSQNPDGLRSEEDYRRLATKLGYSVGGLKLRFTKARHRAQQRQRVGIEGLCIAARRALAEMDR